MNAATLVTSNLPFNEWTEAFGSERLTGALLDRLTHHVHILEMNGESYRLKDSKRRAPEATFLATPVYGADLQGRLPLRPKRAPPSGSQAYTPAAPRISLKPKPPPPGTGLLFRRSTGLVLLRP